MVRLLYSSSRSSGIHKLWDLLEGKAPFDGSNFTHNREYTSHAHIAQFIDLLGPPPKEFLARGTNSGLYFNSGSRDVSFRILYSSLNSLTI